MYNTQKICEHCGWGAKYNQDFDIKNIAGILHCPECNNMLLTKPWSPNF